MTQPPIQVDSGRLSGELEQLARFSEVEPPAVTRILFSPEDLRARAFLKSRFAAAGLAVREDPVGNLFARWQGADPRLPAVGTGSHTDAIPHSGRYDGTVGVLGALEALRCRAATGWRPIRSIELLMFTSEEPTRFGIGCVGSRLLSGSLSAEKAAALACPSSGTTLESFRRQAGFTGSLADVWLPSGTYSAFVGIAYRTGPAAGARGDSDRRGDGDCRARRPCGVRLEGQGGHAGAVLMPDRKDARTALPRRSCWP